MQEEYRQQMPEKPMWFNLRECDRQITVKETMLVKAQTRIKELTAEQTALREKVKTLLAEKQADINMRNAQEMDLNKELKELREQREALQLCLPSESDATE